MGGPEMVVAIGQRQVIGNSEVEAVQQAPIAPPRRNFSYVAEAEANHLIVGDALGIGASLVVVGGRSGFVIPDRLHPTMAMAHRHGNTHDKWLTEKVLGADSGSHANAAESYIENDRETRNDLASALDTERSMGRSRIRSVIDESRKQQKERVIPRATLFIRNADGSRLKLENVKAERGVVALPDKVIDLTPKIDKKKELEETRSTKQDPETDQKAVKVDEKVDSNVFGERNKNNGIVVFDILDLTPEAKKQIMTNDKARKRDEERSNEVLNGSQSEFELVG